MGRPGLPGLSKAIAILMAVTFVPAGLAEVSVATTPCTQRDGELDTSADLEASGARGCNDTLGSGLPPIQVTSSPATPTQACAQPPCASVEQEYIWLKGHWTLCNATCDGGERLRPVICYGHHSHVPDHMCTRSKPKSREECGTIACPGQWKIGDWSQCTASCGVGIQWRHIACHLRHHHPHHHHHGDSDDTQTQRRRRGVQVGALALCSAALRPAKLRFCEGASNSCPLIASPNQDNRELVLNGSKRPSANVPRRPTESWEQVTHPSNTSQRERRSSNEKAMESFSRAARLALSLLRRDQQRRRRRQRRSHSAEAEDNSFFHASQEMEGHWRIDTGPCTASCGGGVQVNTPVCQADHHDHGILYNDIVCGNVPKPETRYTACRTQPCPYAIYQWLDADWRECSAHCGNGTRSRRQICVKMTVNTARNGTQQSHVERVGDRGHCDASRPVVIAEPCTSRECSEWTTGNWTECSVECGPSEGRQWRKVTCHTVETGSPSDACDVSSQPNHSRPCTAASRECRFAWHLEVGNCSEECGGGTLLLTAVCRASVDRGHAQLPDFVCGAADKPRSSRAVCNTDPCPIREITEEWGECQRSCGSGRQLRQRCVRYVDALTREAINEPRCTVLEERVCNAFDCPYTLTWSNWGNCSTACGHGEQSRAPTCELVVANGTRYQYTPSSSTTDFPAECDRALVEAEPARRACFGLNCVYKWRSGDWSECSTSCNPGWRRCNVTCCREDTSSGVAVEMLDKEINCPQPKPTTTMPCNEDNHCPRYEQSLTWGECNASCNGLGMEFMEWRCMRGHRQVEMSECRSQPPHGLRKRTCHGHPCPKPPRFMLDGEEVTGFPIVVVPRGSAATLRCPVFGYPPPTVTWSWLDPDQHQFFEDLRSLNSLKYQQRGSLLSIPASATERLRGKFTCTGSNAALQKAKASGELAIASAPEFDAGSGMVSGNVNLRGRSSFQFRCPVHGYPRPVVTFYKDNVLIAGEDLRDGGGARSGCNCRVRDGALMLRNISSLHSGSYTCVANNSFGSAESQAAIVTVAPFFFWKATLGHCSTTCGRGTRDYEYECHEDVLGRVGIVFCAHASRTLLPPIPCNLPECQAQLRLKLKWDSWSGCSATCGPGVRRRTRVCRKRHNAAAGSSGGDSDDVANATTAPSPDYPLERCLAGMSAAAAAAAAAERTQTQACHAPCNSVWHYEPAGACSVTCGAGVQQLRASCLRYTKNRKWKVTNSEEKCRLRRGDKLTARPCQGLPANGSECAPVIGIWWPGAWYPCANFYRNREVYCYVGGRRVAQHLCTAAGATKPHLRESCVRWQISGWSECVDCFQRRNVTCYFTDPLREVPLSYCREVAAEPDRYQSCGDCPQHRFSQTRTPNPRPNLDRMLSNVDKCTKPGLHYCSRVMSVRLCRKAYYQEKCNCECKRVLHAAREAVRAAAAA